MIILIICSYNAFANDTHIDSSWTKLSILDIGHYNSDHSLDTLYGVGTNFMLYPRFIHWGNDTNRVTSIPSHLLVAKTKIKYPDFERIQIAGFSHKINQDTLQDLGLFVWGKADTSQTANDTIRSYVLFGQNGLDTLTVLDLSDVDSLKTSPFIAMNMRIGDDISNIQIRDYTYFPSFQINSIDHEVLTPPGPELNLEDLPAENSIIIKLYPNPATYYTNVEINTLNNGLFELKLFDLDGNQQWNLDVNVAANETVLNRIDLERMSIGSYVLQVYSNGRYINSYKLIVIK